MSCPSSSFPPPPSPGATSSAMSPPSFTLNLRALLTLPYRLCNPPPAAGNVRSCKVTPLIKVSLDDVLNKRHLPPLTLKDFEEWLVFVEGCPQYLYFLLWLKEYEARYATWLARSGCELPTTASPPKSASASTLDSAIPPTTDLSESYINLIPPCASLALFFTRAKQTFLDPAPHAQYALGPDALAALAAAHSPSTHSFSPSIPHFTIPPLTDPQVTLLPAALTSHPHPHPRELAPLANYARLALKERLQRFVAGACHNVGTRRAWCGIAAGVLGAILFGVIPTLVALFWAPTRWWRVAGWLGCWVGGTLIVSSFHGICMLVYVFGDLRQLRSFELARPAISSPRAIARARPRLRSFFTQTPDVSPVGTESTNSSTSANKTPSQTAPMQQRHAPALFIPPAPHAIREKADPSWSAISETSTGTPIVRFDPGAFFFPASSGTTTVDIDVEAVSDIRVASNPVTDGGEAAVEEDDGIGIEISPAYYPEGMGPVASTGEAVQNESQRSIVRSGLESVRSGAGRMLTWVLRSGRTSETESGKEEGVVSHAGTFGVRGGLGSLSELGDGGDLEKGIETEDEGAEPDAEVFTAEFIPREYPAVEVPAAVEPSAPAVQFDFDQLPTASARLSLALPTPAPRPTSVTEAPRAHIPQHAPPRRRHSLAHSPPQSPRPLLPSTYLSPPRTPLYTHPGMSVPLPPTLSPVPPCVSAVPTERQWWDTCPRHPAVEAKIGLQRRSSTPSTSLSQTQTQYGSPTALLPPPIPRSAHSATRPSSRASSDVHSRARTPEKETASSWRKRFRHVMSVPAFGPLTRVLSPIVARGQWEIVVRSAVVSAFCSWLVIGCLVALPMVN